MKILIKGLKVVLEDGDGGTSSHRLALLKGFARRPHKGFSLRIVAFSDYRVQSIEALIDFLGRRQTPDLILYAGDDIGRFRPGRKNYFQEIAKLSAYGFCAVAGNDDSPTLRKRIAGRHVYPVHSRALVLGDFAVVGLEGAPLFPGEPNKNRGRLLYPDRVARLQTRLWNARAFRKKKLIIVSHAPPFETLDFAVRFGPHRIGSRPLRDFLEANPHVLLCVCGHVHRCGGQTAKVRNTLVVNVASHDSPGDPGKVAIIQIKRGRISSVDWHRLP